jgi:hypothetical protein
MSDDHGKCQDCGYDTDRRDKLNDHIYPYRYLCAPCSKRRDRAYDDYVDPLHWYHGHDPDCIREG